RLVDLRFVAQPLLFERELSIQPGSLGLLLTRNYHRLALATRFRDAVALLLQLLILVHVNPLSAKASALALVEQHKAVAANDHYIPLEILGEAVRALLVGVGALHKPAVLELDGDHGIVWFDVLQRDRHDGAAVGGTRRRERRELLANRLRRALPRPHCERLGGVLSR